MAASPEALRAQAAEHRSKAVELRARATRSSTHTTDFLKMAGDYDLMARQLEEIADERATPRSRRRI
jgi:hypothetical protein